MCLIDVLRHDFEEERVGAVDVEQSVKVRDELVFYTGDFIWFSCDEELVVVCLDMFGKWFDMADREPLIRDSSSVYWFVWSPDSMAFSEYPTMSTSKCLTISNRGAAMFFGRSLL